VADINTTAAAVASSGSSGGLLLGGVVDSLVRELLAATLKQLTPQEVRPIGQMLAVLSTSVCKTPWAETSAG
jgi:hypothetical protein